MMRKHPRLMRVSSIVALVAVLSLVASPAGAHTMNPGMAETNPDQGEISPQHTIISSCGEVDFTVYRVYPSGTGYARVTIVSYRGPIVSGYWKITWGDGTSSSGYIPPNRGTYSFQVSHSYPNPYQSYTATLTGWVIAAGAVCSFIPHSHTL